MKTKILENKKENSSKRNFVEKKIRQTKIRHKANSSKKRIKKETLGQKFAKKNSFFSRIFTKFFFHEKTPKILHEF